MGEPSFLSLQDTGGWLFQQGERQDHRFPKGQQFRWTMLNLGKVEIKGIDVSTETTVNPVKDLFVTLRIQYTYQKAQDFTDPSDTYYGDQIPYIPWHSGSAIAQASFKGWNLN
mgnify:FL=1